MSIAPVFGQGPNLYRVDVPLPDSGLIVPIYARGATGATARQAVASRTAVSAERFRQISDCPVTKVDLDSEVIL